MRHSVPVFIGGLLLLLLAGYRGWPAGSMAAPFASAQTVETLEAVLAEGVTETFEPVSPTTEFADTVEQIYVVLRVEKATSVRAEWIAVNTEGGEPNHKLTDSRLSLRAGQRGAMQIKAPRGGFAIGEYRVDLYVSGSVVQSLPFKVAALLPSAPLAGQAEMPRGFNIALAALGGTVESMTSQDNDSTWAAANLIDGVPFIPGGRGCRPSCGWQSKDGTLPQEIVFSFHEGREALIAAVVIDTATYEVATYGGKSLQNQPKHVEIWTSTTSPSDGYTKVAAARLQERAADHLIALPPTRAKYVKVAFLSNHGGSRTQAAEVKIIEVTDGSSSIVSDVPKNLALPALGGTIVWFTSQDGHRPVSELVDGQVTTKGGWASGAGAYGPASYLPQDIVFAFHGDQVALIDRIVLNPTSGPGYDVDARNPYGPPAWPKRVAVLVSTESPFDGFPEVGQFTLAQEPRDQEFPIGRQARFVKLRILQNFGSPHDTTLGEVKLIEGSAPGYESILRTSEATVATSAAPSRPPADETGIAVETEPNNTPAEANVLELDRLTKGTIDPLREEDYFTLSVPGDDSAVLPLELLGKPYLRTSLTLLDASGKALRHFDPARRAAQRVNFSWAIAPGDYVVKVTEPPIALVLIWDTSGSMGQSFRDLQQAAEAYLDQVRASERLNLIRFSDQVEVLLPEFTDDREQLKAATQGKFFAEGGTPFYDAVAKGMELLEGAQGNRAIVVMTDGADSSSRLQHPDFWRLLEQRRLRLYTIGLGGEMRGYSPRIRTSPNRLLAHAAMATSGRFFFARTSEELQGFYQQIADELRTPSTYYVRPTVSRGPGRLSVEVTGERMTAMAAPPQIELILDASGSMKQKVDGRPKIDTAKEVMAQIIDSLPEETRVALRIYGHRIREKQPGDCHDSELVFPFAKVDKTRLLERVRGIRALGTTPIAYSLQQVPGDFGNAPGEKIVILVTDGIEECKGNPSAVVADLLAKGFKARLNIVGFAIANQAAKQEMQRLAELTEGHFFDAKNGKGLREAIEQALAIPYDVLDASGAKVRGGLTGQGTIDVPEGIYTVVVQTTGKPITIPEVRVTQNGLTKVELKKAGQEIGVQVVGP